MTHFMMGTTSSITVQSLGKIAQCAPAVAKFFRAPCRVKSIFRSNVSKTYGPSIRWIEKWISPFMMGTTSSITMQSLDKIVQRCRCENVVFVFCLFFTGRMPLSGKLPVLNLLTGQKWGFSPHRGDSLHRFTSNLAGLTGTWLRLAVQTFSSIATGGGNAAPKIWIISTFS